jgi:hypothetical protein
MSKRGFPSKIHEIIEQIDRSIREICHKAASDSQLETAGCLVYEQLALRNLYYHGLDRALLLARKAEDPYRRIAYIFSDLVAWRTDPVHNSRLRTLCSDTLYDSEGVITVPRTESPIEVRITHLFRQQPGSRFSHAKGADSYLSALLFSRLFSDVLSEDAVLTIVCMMHEVNSYLRLRANKDQDLDLSVLSDICAKQLSKTRGCLLYSAYSFIFNEDSGYLITYLWQKTPEVFIRLQRDGYSIKDYLEALLRIEDFTQSIDADTLLLPFATSPNAAWMGKNLRTNLGVARDYVRAKILAAAILDALATESGGDAPIMLFMGHFSEKVGMRFEDLLTATATTPDNTNSNRNQSVLKLLELGRKSDVFYDMKTSPFAAYLYYELTSEDYQRAVEAAHSLYQSNRNGRELLDVLPPAMRVSILDAAARMVPTRRNALTKLK